MIFARIAIISPKPGMGRKAAESHAAHSSRRHLIAKEKRGAIRGATLQDAAPAETNRKHVPP